MIVAHAPRLLRTHPIVIIALILPLILTATLTYTKLLRSTGSSTTVPHSTGSIILTMNTKGQTHYEALKVNRSATSSEIQAAYYKILLASHPDNTQDQAPFALNLAHQAARTANAAWDVLSDPVRKQDYDASLPYLDPLGDPWRLGNSAPRFGEPSPERKFPRPSGYGFSYGENEETDGQEADDEADEEPQSQSGGPEEAPGTEVAEYRYGST
jgi:hypothetical protein